MKHRAAFVFIFVTILLDMLALGMVIPVFPKLIESFMGNDAAAGARMFGIFGTVWALMQFVASPIVGALSDRFGRRPIVLMSNFGLGLDYILMALAPSLTWLFVGRVISGITAASISTAFAYIADVSEPDKRAERFGTLGAAFGIGFIVGPALGGLLGNYAGPRAPFAVAAALSIANGLYGTFILPESLPKERRSPFTWAKANWFGALKLLRSHADLLPLAGVNFLGNLAHMALQSTFVLYASYRYHWDDREVGFALAGVGLTMAIVQAGLMKPIKEKLGEQRSLILGLSAGAIAFAIYGFAPNGAVFSIGIPVMAFYGLAGPSVQSLMSRHVGADEQGQLQGANGSLLGIAGIIGPALFTGVFAQAIAGSVVVSGAPFLLAAGVLVLGVFMASRRGAPVVA